MTQTYELLLQQTAALVADEHAEMSVLANVAALLKSAFPEKYFWVGFYLVRNDELQLGPFQGTVACMHIGRGRGVCGTAWAEARTIVVDDVEAFPGHIACSSLSRSEIVVPIRGKAGTVVGVLDIDSLKLADFNATDAHYLEKLCKIIAQALDY